MHPPLEGSCQCGAVTYTVSAEPLFTYACHCSSCQKRTGSAFSLGLVIATDVLTSVAIGGYVIAGVLGLALLVSILRSKNL